MNNKTIFFVINVAVFFIILFFVYHFMYLSSLESYRYSKGNYSKLKSANLDLSEFDDMKKNVEEKQPVFEETFEKYKDSFITNDELIHGYEDKVGEVLKNNEILKSSKTVQYILDDNEMKNISLSLKFNVPYDNVYPALFDIEKFSIVNKFYMTNNNVQFECKPILHDLELDEFFMGRSGYISTDKTLNNEDFKKLYNELDKLSHFNIPSWRDLLPVPRNPFTSRLTPEQAKSIKKDTTAIPRGTPAKIKDIYIEGILFEKNAPVCVIEGNLYRTGSFYKNDVKILRIVRNGIIVKYKGVNYKIKTNYK